MPTTLKSCTCAMPLPCQPLKVLETNGDAAQWSRMDPLGGLLDPKLYPVQKELPDAPCARVRSPVEVSRNLAFFLLLRIRKRIYLRRILM